MLFIFPWRHLRAEKRILFSKKTIQETVPPQTLRKVWGSLPIRLPLSRYWKPSPFILSFKSANKAVCLNSDHQARFLYLHLHCLHLIGRYSSIHESPSCSVRPITPHRAVRNAHLQSHNRNEERACTWQDPETQLFCLYWQEGSEL